MYAGGEVFQEKHALSISGTRLNLSVEKYEDLYELWQDINDTKSGLDKYWSYLVQQVFRDYYDKEEKINLPNETGILLQRK
jgi:hypothetical protein